MDFNGIDIQAIWNWALGGGFTVATALTAVKTIGQRRLNKKFEELSNSIDLSVVSSKGIEEAKQLAQDSFTKSQQLVAESQKVITERMDSVDTKITNLTDNVLKDDILNRLDEKLAAIEEYKKIIDLKDKTIEKYAADMKQVKIELARLNHKED